MTRTILLLVLACVVVIGGAVAAILGGDRVSSGLTQWASGSGNGPVAVTERKADRLPAAAAPPVSLPKQDRLAALPSDSLRLAFASDSPLDPSRPDLAAPIAIAPSTMPQKPKLTAKPALQKNYSLLSDMQIAGIKGRLKLTAAQETYWPNVEAALRAVARKIHDRKQASGSTPPIDPESAEVAQLKSAAMPLLTQLREDQKREVRALARIIGLEAVASRI